VSGISTTDGITYTYHHNRYNDQHAKFTLIDVGYPSQTLLTGSENLDCDSMPADIKFDGTSGNRGYYVQTDSPALIRDARQQVFDLGDLRTHELACALDEVLGIGRLPERLIILGAGVIGCEYASIFAALGVRVTLIDKRHRLLPFVDEEIVDTLCYHLRENRVTLRLNESVQSIEVAEDGDGPGNRVRLHLESGKTIVTEKALYAVGRTGATNRLALDKCGIACDERGRLVVDEHYCTATPNIYAVGDVIGFPALASTSMEQGRLAVCRCFGVSATSVPALFPFGIYSVPEISMVGKTEEELTQAGIAYEVGKARYREIARGQIIGDTTGLLKLIFHSETRELLGVHIIGDGASELIHIGQAVLAFGGTIDYFINTVFNYPTLAECYKVAAFDGINRIGVFHEADAPDPPLAA
jgi:NAD(P) transhydrogenase